MLLLLLLPLGRSLQAKQGSLSPSAHRSFWVALLPKLLVVAGAHSKVYSQNCAEHFAVVSCLASLLCDRQMRLPAFSRILALLVWKKGC